MYSSRDSMYSKIMFFFAFKHNKYEKIDLVIGFVSFERGCPLSMKHVCLLNALKLINNMALLLVLLYAHPNSFSASLCGIFFLSKEQGVGADMENVKQIIQTILLRSKFYQKIHKL